MVTFNEIQIYGRKFYPAILLDQFMRYKTRLAFRKILTGFLIVIFVLMVLAPYSNTGLLGWLLPVQLQDAMFLNLYKIRGVFFAVFVLWLNGYLYEAFYVSHYLEKARVEYEVARLAYTADRNDLTASFLKSEIGEYTMFRLGLSRERVNQFIKDQSREKLRQSDLLFKYNALHSINDDERVINLPDYIKTIYEKDLDFQYFLQKSDILERDLFGALKWVQNILYQIKTAQRLSSRERLIRIRTIGQNWYSRETDYIKKYAHLIYENKFYQALGRDWQFFRDEAEHMEDLLLDEKKENLLIISEKISTGMQIVSTFGKMIADGVCIHCFENKKIFVLNIDVLKIHNKNGEEFEKTFLKMIEQAVNTRDIIFVIPNLPELFLMTNELGLDLTEMLSGLLDDIDTPFIAVAKRDEYRDCLETDLVLNQSFDKYIVPNIDQDFLIKILSNEALKIEAHDDIYITYQSIRDIADKFTGVKNSVKKALVELHKIYQT